LLEGASTKRVTQLALGIALIEACSQVHGARIHGQSVGSFGDVLTHRPHPAPAPARVVRYPALSGSCSEIYLERCFQEAGLAPAERLPVARELGDTSLMFLLHPTITHKQMAGYAEAVRTVEARACR
jgi:dTDP-4-amino-4,6-dideoxygalactose transaminase